MKQIQVGSHLWIIKPPLRFLMDRPLTAWAVQVAILTLDRLWLHGRLQAVEQTVVPMWLRPCHSRSSLVAFLPQTDQSKDPEAPDASARRRQSEQDLGVKPSAQGRAGKLFKTSATQDLLCRMFTLPSALGS